MTLTIILSIVAGIAVGFGIAKFLEKSNVSNLIKNAKKEAASILKDAKAEAESIKKDKLLQAKEKFLELKSEHEKEILAKDKKIAEAEKRTRDKESQVSNELAKNKKLNEELETKIEDRGVRQVVWNASYKRALESGQSEAQARSTADRETISTQGSAERMDRAPLFRGATGKLFAALLS